MHIVLTVAVEDAGPYKETAAAHSIKKETFVFHNSADVDVEVCGSSVLISFAVQAVELLWNLLWTEFSVDFKPFLTFPHLPQPLQQLRKIYNLSSLRESEGVKGR